MNFDDLRDYFSRSSNDDDITLAPHATEEICCFLDQHLEKLDDNQVFTAFCLLVEIAICCRDNAESVKNEVEALYTALAINSDTSIQEFHQLGEAIAVITRICAEQGEESLRGCRLSLPFCERIAVDEIGGGSVKESNGNQERNANSDTSSASSSSSSSDSRRCINKVIIKISTVSHLFAIHRLWCNVSVRILSVKVQVPAAFSIPKCFHTIATLSSYLHLLNTPCCVIKSLCLSAITILKMSPSSCPSTLRVLLAIDILNWLSGTYLLLNPTKIGYIEKRRGEERRGEERRLATINAFDVEVLILIVDHLACNN